METRMAEMEAELRALKQTVAALAPPLLAESVLRELRQRGALLVVKMAHSEMEEVVHSAVSVKNKNTNGEQEESTEPAVVEDSEDEEAVVVEEEEANPGVALVEEEDDIEDEEEKEEDEKEANEAEEGGEEEEEEEPQLTEVETSQESAASSASSADDLSLRAFDVAVTTTKIASPVSIVMPVVSPPMRPPVIVSPVNCELVARPPPPTMMALLQEQLRTPVQAAPPAPRPAPMHTPCPLPHQAARPGLPSPKMSVPVDFEVQTKDSVAVAWEKWVCGDEDRGFPPFRSITAKQIARKAEVRRLCDMRCAMMPIETLAKQKGMWKPEWSRPEAAAVFWALQSQLPMFETTAGGRARKKEIAWSTALNTMRRGKKRKQQDGEGQTMVV